MIATNREKLERATIILAKGDGAIAERLALAYLFALAWIYPDDTFAGHECEFDLLRDEAARVYYNREGLSAERLADLERRVLTLSNLLLRRATPNSPNNDAAPF